MGSLLSQSTEVESIPAEVRLLNYRSDADGSVSNWLLPPGSAAPPLPDRPAPAVLKLHAGSLQEPPARPSSAPYLSILHLL